MVNRIGNYKSGIHIYIYQETRAHTFAYLYRNIANILKVKYTILGTQRFSVSTKVRSGGIGKFNYCRKFGGSRGNRMLRRMRFSLCVCVYECVTKVGKLELTRWRKPPSPSPWNEMRISVEHTHNNAYLSRDGERADPLKYICVYVFAWWLRARGSGMGLVAITGMVVVIY